MVEILVALVIMVFVSSGVLLVFQYQSRNAAVQRDIAEMNLMAKGLNEELTRTIRMAGGVLPPGNGGLRVFGSGNEKITVVLNRAGGVDTTRSPSVFHNLSFGGYSKPIVFPVKNVRGVFTDKGYVLTTVRVPPMGSLAGTPPIRDTMIVLPVLALIPAGSSIDTIAGPAVVADGSWFAANWAWRDAVKTDVNTFVYALDSVRYKISHDTLYRRINRNDSAAYAIGIDTLKLKYMHPSKVWLDSLSPADPANQVSKVRLHVRMRTRNKDVTLARTNPSTLGYRYQVVESEVSLRNSTTLVNQ